MPVMSKHCLASFICTFFVFIQTAEAYRIEVQIQDLPEQELRLGRHSGPDAFIVDTAVTDKTGLAVFEGPGKLDHGVYFIVFPSAANFDILIDEDQAFFVSTWQFHILDSLKQEGSFQNQAFIEFQKRMAAFNKRGHQLQVEKKFHERQNDKQALDQVKKRLVSLSDERKHYYDSISSLFEGVLLGDIIKALIPVTAPPDVKAMQGMYPEKYFNWYEGHFFDHINFAEPGVFNTPEYIFHQKMQQYCRYFINRDPQNKEDVQNMIDNLLSKASASETAYRYVMGFLVDFYNTPGVIGADWILVYLYDAYFNKNKVPWASGEIMALLETRVDQRRNNLVGMEADHFSLPDADGNDYQPIIQGEDYTILWFWDDECDVCIQRSKQLHDVYSALKNKNAEVVAVFLGDKRENWLSLVEKHDFNWINVWNPDEEYHLDKNYGLHKTPRMFVLDANGIIRAKDIQPDKVEKTIDYFNTKNPALMQEFQFNPPKMQEHPSPK